MKKIICILLFIALLTSCEQSPVSGYVVGKKHTPRHTTSYYDVTLKISRVRVVPESYVVWVADSCRVTPCHVDKQTFERLQHGQYVTQKK